MSYEEDYEKNTYMRNDIKARLEKVCACINLKDNPNVVTNALEILGEVQENIGVSMDLEELQEKLQQAVQSLNSFFDHETDAIMDIFDEIGKTCDAEAQVNDPDMHTTMGLGLTNILEAQNKALHQERELHKTTLEAKNKPAKKKLNDPPEKSI